MERRGSIRGPMTQIYLVPGFLGFQSFGEASYFRRVPSMLRELLKELGHENIEVFECPTIPSGSIARRAQRELEFIAAHGGEQAENTSSADRFERIGKLSR